MKKFITTLLFFYVSTSVMAASVKMIVDNDWGGGFVAKVVIDNTDGDTPVVNWELEFDFEREISRMWQGSFSKNGVTYVVTHDGWNRTVAVGEKMEVGFQGGPGNITDVPTVTLHSDGGGDNDGAVACGVDPSTLPNDDDWLTTNGNQIVDSNGKSVWLTGANWFGFNTSERVFHGLWSANMENLLEQVAVRGINILRVPIGTELLKEWKNGVFKATTVNLFENPRLIGKNTLEIFDYFLSVAKACGIKVIVDVHHPEQDNTGFTYWGWAKDDITLDDFYDTWEWLAERYKDDDTIVAVDLQNEPHGIPKGSVGIDVEQGENQSDRDFCLSRPDSERTDYAKWDNSTDDNNWRHIAQTVAAKILAKNPHLLILVEGVEVYGIYGNSPNNIPNPNIPDPCLSFNWWGGNLKGVRDLEVEVPGLQNQIMYSPHDYGPSLYVQPWFDKDFNRDTLRIDVWEPFWLYIHNEGISPLLIGEWGGFLDGGDNQKWLEALRDEIAEVRLHHTFWAINPNSGDTGGLLKNDWATWNEEKYQLLEPALWRSESGKFISLDHKAKLGGTAGTGISVSDL